MRGLRAGSAEVVGSGDDPGAEVMLPNAVDHDPREERVLGGSDPVCERGTAAGGHPICGLRDLELPAERRRHSGLHLCAGLVVNAALEQVMHRRGRIGFDECRDLLGRLGPFLLAGSDRLLHGISQRGILREALREFVLADGGFGGELAFLAQLLAERLGECREAILSGLHLFVDQFDAPNLRTSGHAHHAVVRLRPLFGVIDREENRL